MQYSYKKTVMCPQRPIRSMTCDERGGDWNYAAASQVIPKIFRKPPKSRNRQGRGRMFLLVHWFWTSSLQTSEKTNKQNSWTSSTQNFEKLSHPVCVTLPWQPWKLILTEYRFLSKFCCFQYIWLWYLTKLSFSFLWCKFWKVKFTL